MTISIDQVIAALNTARELIRAYVPVNPLYATDVQALFNSAGDDCDRAALKLSEAQVEETGAFQTPGPGLAEF